MIEVLSTVQTINTAANNAVGGALNQVSDTAGFVNNAVSTLLYPESVQGISGWMFDVRRTEQIDIEADITDHYMEDNSFINDHIVRRPVTIQLSGYIGELVATKPAGIDAALSFLSNTLSSISAYLGDYSSQTMQTMQSIISQSQSYINTATAAVNKTKNLVKQLSNFGINLTKQQQAYQDLLSFYLSNDLLTVQTPWAIHENMKIQKIGFVQGDESTDYSDISITLKEMRFSSIGIANFDGQLFDQRNEMMSSTEKALGKINGVQEDQGLLLSLFGGFVK
jgi:hypothetical protein